MAEAIVKLLLSVPETASALGIGTTTVKKLIRDGQLGSVKIGDRRLVPAEAAQAFAASLIETAA